jgi:hypothetical protein
MSRTAIPSKKSSSKSRDVNNEGQTTQRKNQNVTNAVDFRDSNITQRKIVAHADNQSRTKQLKAIQKRTSNSNSSGKAAQLQALTQRKENNTGLPDNLKSGVESLSGQSMDDVKVHYNSSEPANVQAHAYAQGSDIHVGPGQEQHLPHEAWHVAQQKQGRVQPTTEVNGMPVNDSPALEAEADNMGAKATQMVAKDSDAPLQKKALSSSAPVQRDVDEAIMEDLINQAEALDEEEESDLEYGRAFGDVNDSEAVDKDENASKSTLKTGEDSSVSLGKDGLELEAGNAGLGISKEGVKAKFKPFGEDGPEVSLAKDEGEVAFKIPGTGFNFPPPSGNWQGPGFQMPIATPIPGLFVNVSGGLTGGIKIPQLETKLKYSKKPMNKGRHTRVQVEISLANEKSITATFGGNIRVGVLGGVPMVAAVEAGVEAATEAKIEITPGLSGKAMFVENNETGDVDASKTSISAQLGGSAGLEASLSLYLSGQIIMFKGDLLKLTLLSKDIAKVKGGAVVKREWVNGAKGKNIIEPVYDEGYFHAESWFQDLFKADKLEKAKENLVGAQYDVYALEDLKHFLKVGGKQGQHANMEIRRAQSEVRAAETESLMIMKQLEDQEMSTAERGKLNKQLTALSKKIKQANADWTAARNKFLSDKSVKNLDKNLASANKSLEKQKGANEKLLAKELKKFHAEFDPKKAAVELAFEEAQSLAIDAQLMVDKNISGMGAYNESLLQEATKKRAKAAIELEDFKKMYDAEEARVRELVETPSKDPLEGQAAPNP